MKFSLCIAVFNEEDQIHYPLKSCIDWVDEVVVVDGGSTDKTVQIAQSYGSKVHVIHADNPAMFHMNKQKAIEAAHGDWILQLDADEAVDRELQKEIQSVIAEDQTHNPVAYWIPRKNYFLNRFLTRGGVYPDMTIRLYKKGVAHFPCKTVHENVAVNGSVGTLKHDLLHYADPDFSRYLKRWDRYTSLDAQIAVEKKEHLCGPCYFFGKPVYTFFMMYFRHRGFVDGFPGFVFALFSAIRYWVIYIKVWQINHQK